MDTHPTFNEYLKTLLIILRSYGSRRTLGWLHMNLPTIKHVILAERKESIKYEVNAINRLLTLSAVKEDESQLRLISELIRSGFDIDRDLYAHLIPKSNYLIYYRPSTGRLGDLISQLSLPLAMWLTDSILFSVHTPSAISSSEGFLIGGNIRLHSERLLCVEADQQSISRFASEDAKKLSVNCPWILREISPLLFDKIHSDRPSDLKDDCISIHLRGGDMMFSPIYIPQPPLSYYLRCIQLSGTKSVALIVEPDRPEIGRINPLPQLIMKYCQEKGLECAMRSGSIEEDSCWLYHSRQVICGVSSFGRSIAYSSRICKHIFVPDDPEEGISDKDRMLIHEKVNKNYEPKVTRIKHWDYPRQSEWMNLSTRLAWIINS